MSVLAEFSIVPLGKGAGMSEFIAQVLKAVIDSGVSYRTNPMGTVLEGDWDEVMGVIRKCHHLIMQGSERVLTTIRIDDRRDGGPRMEQKLESVERKLGMRLSR